MVNFVNRNDQILWYTFISLQCVCWLIDYCHKSYMLNAQFYFHFIAIFITLRTQYKHRYLNVSLSTIDCRLSKWTFIVCTLLYLYVFGICMISYHISCLYMLKLWRISIESIVYILRVLNVYFFLCLFVLRIKWYLQWLYMCLCIEHMNN